MHGALCFAALALSVTTAAVAQDVWIGRPTIGDVHRHQISELILAQRQASQSKSQFNSDIARARADFFKTASTPDSRADAEKRFADLLQAKDLMYLSTLAIEGTGVDASKRTEAIHMVTGGQIDGGIPQQARPAFDRWVNAVRQNLGARSPNELLWVWHQDQWIKAITASTDSYERYKAERDKAEIDAYNKRRASAAGYASPAWASVKAAMEAGRNPDGSRNLHNKTIVAFNPQQHLNLGAAKNPATYRKVRDIAATWAGSDGLQVIECAYGPMEAQENGPGKWTLIYDHLRFWYRTVPQRLDEMIAENRSALAFSHGRDATHLYMAIDDCGATNEGTRAMILANHARAVPPESMEKTMERRRAEVEAQQAERTAASRERMCARSAARIEQVRQQTAAAGGLRRQQQLQAMERNHSQACGG